MRLIDADELEELFREVIGSIANRPEIQADLEHMVRASAMTVEMIKDAPTIDAVHVVRCKDCKHSEPWYSDKSRCFLWHETGIDVFNDGFCNYGERKEGR